MKLHFISSVVFAGLVAFLAISEDINTRMILLVPVLVVFYITWVLFGYEYVRLNLFLT